MEELNNKKEEEKEKKRGFLYLIGIRNKKLFGLIIALLITIVGLSTFCHFLIPIPLSILLRKKPLNPTDNFDFLFDYLDRLLMGSVFILTLFFL